MRTSIPPRGSLWYPLRVIWRRSLSGAVRDKLSCSAALQLPPRGALQAEASGVRPAPPLWGVALRHEDRPGTLWPLAGRFIAPPAGQVLTASGSGSAGHWCGGNGLPGVGSSSVQVRSLPSESIEPPMARDG